MSKSKSKIIPLADRVLVRPFSEDELGHTTSSGIIIPDTIDKEKSHMGEVVAVGPGKVNDDGKIVPMNVKKGQKVVFPKYGGDEIKDSEGVEHLIIKEDNILAIIE